VGKLNKREASYPGKINVRIMDFISGLEKSDFLQGKTSCAETSYPGSTVYGKQFLEKLRNPMQGCKSFQTSRGHLKILDATIQNVITMATLHL
jgi:hypothetical protein